MITRFFCSAKAGTIAALGSDVPYADDLHHGRSQATVPSSGLSAPLSPRDAAQGTRARRALPWLAYPCVMSGAIGLHLALVATGAAVHVSSYAAGAAGALLVAVLERTSPHLLEWRAARDEIATDAVYVLVVQVLLPYFLAVSLGIHAVDVVQRAGLEPSALWPHAWPAGAQAALMLLAADFLRYWLHVACHRFAPLWRLHAVHHSPDKLYWLNVGRFHPAEKVLQYLLDALPFVLLGVSAEVLGIYFVFYAVNGFFQHSNVELRFGWLNHVISTAELHRWHHSSNATESNANYGNNLILWDLVFGTRCLPRDRQVANLGLGNRRYPRGFAEQLRAPLVDGIEQSEMPLPRPRELALHALIRLRMAWVGWTSWPRLRAAAKDPARAQRARLRAILAANRHTEFGRRHGFAEIESYEDYLARVPLQTYESLRPYIERQEQEGVPALTGETAIFYAQTSGSTGQPKYVPVLRTSLRAHKRSQALVMYHQHRAEPRAYAGRLLAIAGPAVEGRLPGGAPFGSTSGHVYRTMPRAMRSKHVLPHEVFDIEDYELRYLAIVRLAIGAGNISYAAAANPSTFLKLLGVVREHRAALLRDVECQSFHRIDDVHAAARQAIRPRLRCTPDRIAELRAVLAQADLELADLWPSLRLVTTWTGGSCGIALGAVRRSLPADTRIADLGYLATELLGTVTIDPSRRVALPALQDTFFEFVEKERFERDDIVFETIERLQEGREYYVVITTATGLYRYFMNDILRVTGRFEGTPTLEFVQKGRGVTNITGEKLYEGQVLQAVEAAARSLGLTCPFFLMLADTGAARYTLLIEPTAPAIEVDAGRMAAVVDAALAGLNVEYAQKRASGRLKPLEVRVLCSGTGEAYKRHCVSCGQREGQFKPQVLQYLDQLEFAYDAHVAPRH